MKRIDAIYIKESGDTVDIESYINVENTIVIRADGVVRVGGAIFVNTINAGVFANRPEQPPIGFQYYCTDRQTPEGGMDGIQIYHKGGNTWIDALGRIVS
jgi:hypothetical protein